MKKNKKLFITLLVFLIIISAGLGLYLNRNGAVNWIFLKVYGIDTNIVKLSDSEIIQTAKDFRIDTKYALCKVDTNFNHFIDSLQQNDSAVAKNHYQPLQAMYFDRHGKMVSFFINCAAGGFPNLKWNRNNVFDTFPPAQQADNLVDSVVYSDIQPFLLPVARQNANDANTDYYVLVFWNKFMGRQSKRLIDIVQENIKLSKDNVKVIFVNTDNFIADME